MQTTSLSNFLNEMYTIIVQNFSPEKIYVFGSFARIHDLEALYAKLPSEIK